MSHKTSLRLYSLVNSDLPLQNYELRSSLIDIPVPLLPYISFPFSSFSVSTCILEQMVACFIGEFSPGAQEEKKKPYFQMTTIPINPSVWEPNSWVTEKSYEGSEWELEVRGDRAPAGRSLWFVTNVAQGSLLNRQDFNYVTLHVTFRNLSARQEHTCICGFEAFMTCSKHSVS